MDNDGDPKVPSPFMCLSLFGIALIACVAIIFLNLRG